MDQTDKSGCENANNNKNSGLLIYKNEIGTTWHLPNLFVVNSISQRKI